MGRINELRAALWHPYQRLWNWRLVRRARRLPAGNVLDHAIVLVDSLLLAGSALRHRAGPIDSARVLYIDCGVWRDGKQIRLVHEWFGSRVATLDILAFEANPFHFAAAREALSWLPSLDLRQVALVAPGDEGVARLFLTGGGEGNKGDSLLRAKGESVQVPAERLTSHLPASGTYDAVLLRMNIEGAEEFVVDDLIEAGRVDDIDGYFGMWDDLSKIDWARGEAFRALLEEHSIHPSPFNDRDLVHPAWPPTPRRRLYARIRMWSIRREMHSIIASGSRRRCATPS